MKNGLGFEMESERVRIWRRPEIGEVELMQATYVRQRFARHAHARFAVGIIEAGALGFHYRGANVVAPAGAINLANPDEPHTGHAASENGWTYRMFYFDDEHLRAAAAQMAGRPGPVPRFEVGVIHDPGLAGRIAALHRDLEQPETSDLEAQSRFLAMLAALIARHADSRYPHRSVGRETRAVQCARDYIHAHFADSIAIDHLASLSGLSPYHFMRVFHRQVGLPPYAYLLQIRVRRAKTLLQSGCDPAATALTVGFYDQSHLTRHFKRRTGMTPAQYRRMVQENS